MKDQYETVKYTTETVHQQKKFSVGVCHAS